MASEYHPSRASSRGDLEKNALHTGHYSPTEQEQSILDKQLAISEVKASYTMLFRYSTHADLLIMSICSICAIAAGAVLPLITVLFGSFTNTFVSFFSNGTGVAAFRHDISHLALYMIYLGIGCFIAVYIATVGFIYTGEHITQKLRQKYLRAVLRQNIAFFDILGAGEVTTRITADMNTVQDGLSQKVSLTLSGVATFVTALVVGFIKSWRLTLILISIIFAMVFSMGACSKLIMKFNKQAQEFSGTGATLAEEVFSSIRNATALCTQEQLAKEYDSFLLKAEYWGFRLKIASGGMMGVMICIMLSDYGLSFWQGSRFLVAGEANVGHILTILLAVTLGSGALGQVMPHFQAFAVATANAGPIFSVIDRPNPEGSLQVKTLGKVNGAIELRGVRHIYPSRQEVVVLNNLDLTIPAGKITALVGASGSGKSTIVGLLERFYTPVGGQIFLDGHDIQTLDSKWLRTQMALVSQEPVLFGTSVFGNISHGLIGTEHEHARDEKKMALVIEAAKMANAHDFITLLPEGYQTNVGERGFLMSGGQKQRIAIARAVVSDPKILLLDESTSALDTKSEGVVQAALDKASQGRTTIVIAHRLSTIKGADKIVVMSEGSIVEQGTHEDLISRGGAYFQLFEAQKLVTDKNSLADGALNDKDELPASEYIELDQTISAKLTRTTTEKSLTRPKRENSDENFQYSLWELIKFIWQFNKQEKWLMVLGLCISMLCGSALPLQAVYMGKEISSLSLPTDQYPKLRHEVNFWSLMFFITAIFMLISYVAQGAVFGYCSERLIFRARSKAIRSILRQDIAFFDESENTSGALVSILSSEVTSLAGISGTTLGAILSTATTVVEALVIACSINWKLGLVTATAMPYLLCGGFLRFWVLAQFDLRAQKVYKESASYACEATAAIRTIASLTREDEVWEHYNSMLVAQTSSSLHSVLKTSLLYAASQAGMYWASALGFWYGGQLISKYEITMESFFTCFVAIVFSAQAAGGIFSHAPDMSKSKQAAETLKTLFDRVPGIDSWSQEGERLEKGKVEGAIEFRDVHFTYPTRSGQAVLRGADLKFEPGQYIALVGASGCGKSTIVCLIERFYDPTRGSILLDGKDITKLHLGDYRSQIALVSQEPVLYSGTIRDNIVLGCELEVDDEAVAQACRDANIYDFIISLPSGLDTVVGQKGVMLSGGQKQRVAIARALIRNPKILLLDEATSALDSTSEHAVQAAIDLASKGRTTVSIAHRLSTVQNADVIYVIDQGRVVEKGDHSALMERRGRYCEMVKMQGLKGREE